MPFDGYLGTGYCTLEAWGEPPLKYVSSYTAPCLLKRYHCKRREVIGGSSDPRARLSTQGRVAIATLTTHAEANFDSP